MLQMNTKAAPLSSEQDSPCVLYRWKWKCEVCSYYIPSSLLCQVLNLWLSINGFFPLSCYTILYGFVLYLTKEGSFLCQIQSIHPKTISRFLFPLSPPIPKFSQITYIEMPLALNLFLKPIKAKYILPLPLSASLPLPSIHLSLFSSKIPFCSTLS